MLKGYRGPALALCAAIILLLVVIVTRPPRPSPAPAATPTPVVAVLPTETALPTLTPAPTIPFQQLDTSTLHEALVGCIKKLNPLLAGYNQADLDITSLIFDGLTTTNEFGADVPDLAASITASNDGLVYAVKLRGDVLWQDGLPLTSADVIYTFSLMQDQA